MYPQVNENFNSYSTHTRPLLLLRCDGNDSKLLCGQVQVIVTRALNFLYNIGKHFKQFRKQSASFNTKSNHNPCVNSEEIVIRTHNY